MIHHPLFCNLDHITGSKFSTLVYCAKLYSRLHAYHRHTASLSCQSSWLWVTTLHSLPARRLPCSIKHHLLTRCPLKTFSLYLFFFFTTWYWYGRTFKDEFTACTNMFQFFFFLCILCLFNTRSGQPLTGQTSDSPTSHALSHRVTLGWSLRAAFILVFIIEFPHINNSRFISICIEL